MTVPTYLQPYRRAVDANGPRFDSMLWQSPGTQAIRFDALCRLIDLHGKLLCDAGCGRGDLLKYLLARDITPEHYVGIEAVEELAAIARQAESPLCKIVVADFVKQPHRLAVGADVIYFGGSLNTLDDEPFRRTIELAAGAARWVAGSFLCSSARAGVSYLRWRAFSELESLARTHDREITFLSDYLDGDATFLIGRRDE